MLINNLLNNANKYCPDHSQIRLQCFIETVDKSLTIICEDSGPGISTSEIKRVRDRFYRTPSNGAHGAGLGLSIVDVIIKKHHGTWVLGRSEELGGLKVEVHLPFKL
jgi:signal transduction histidine kinase